MAWQDRVIKSVPEVESVAGKLGRAEDAHGSAPVEMIETTIMLKPRAQWRAGMTKEKIDRGTQREAKRDSRLRARISPAHRESHPHVEHGHSRPGGHQDPRLGPRYHPAGRLSDRGSGAEDSGRRQELLPPACRANLISRFTPTASRWPGYGLNIRDVMDVVEIGLGGLNVSTTIEGRARYPIQLRLDRGENDPICARISARSSFRPRMGRPMPLGQVATIRRASGPAKSPAKMDYCASSSKRTCGGATSGDSWPRRSAA